MGTAEYQWRLDSSFGKIDQPLFNDIEALFGNSLYLTGFVVHSQNEETTHRVGESGQFVREPIMMWASNTC